MITVDVHVAVAVLAIFVMFPALLDVFNAYKDWFKCWWESHQKNSLLFLSVRL